MTIEPFKMIDGREVELCVFLQSQVVCAFALFENPIFARDASPGGRHIDDSEKKTKRNKLCNPLDCSCSNGHVTKK